MIWMWHMTKKEFYLVALIVIYTYLAVIFQINLRNINYHENKPVSISTFNVFR